MIEAGLFDGCFPSQESATLGGDNTGLGSRFIRWQRDQVLPTTFFTDTNLKRTLDYRNPRLKKIALLIEPPSLSDTHYYEAFRLRNEFDYVLTHNKEFLKQVYEPKSWLYYPLGGSWIKDEDWGIFDKTRNVSLFVSEKRGAFGHSLRMQVARMKDLYDIDVYGRGYNPVQTKIIGLRPYRYSIVIESIRITGYFSEKLIDCLSQGTIPIYWGAPDVGEFFDMNGIITFNDVDDLTGIMLKISLDDYQSRFFAIENNMALAKDYRCAEDWIYKKYGDILFGEESVL